MRKTFILLFFVAQLFGVDGFVEDALTNRAIKAKICDEIKCVKSDAFGYFQIDTNATKLTIKAVGYRRLSFDADSSKIHFLEPFRVHALYLSFWGANPKTKTYKRILELLDQTKINTVVVDVKNEYGDILYKNNLQKPLQYEAFKHRMVFDIKKFLEPFQKRNTYMIARIVCFKDELQARNNEDYAIKYNGKIWRNHDNMAWVDPFDKRAWRYVVDIAEDAAKQGFDEINFDYIRFPAKKGLTLKRKSTQQNRLNAIATFLEYVKKRLEPYGVFISVDTYGQICWAKDDTGIGQTIENFKAHVDYLCPMLYPSGFASGSFGKEFPSEHPYEVLYKSLAHIQNRIDLKKVRPWIQAFKDYSQRKKLYKAFEIQEQIRACDELHTNGWMLWSPSSKYKVSYFQPNIQDDLIASKESKATTLLP